MSPLPAFHGQATPCSARTFACQQRLSSQRGLSLPLAVHGVACIIGAPMDTKTGRVRGRAHESRMPACDWTQHTSLVVAKEPLSVVCKAVHMKHEAPTSRDKILASAQRFVQQDCPSERSTQSIDRSGNVLSGHLFKGYLHSTPWTPSIDCAGNFRNVTSC